MSSGALECRSEVIMVRTVVCLLLLAGCLLVAGCGYQLANRPESSSPLVGKTVSIPLFANRIYRPQVEAVLTRQMVEEFSQRSGGLVVSEEHAELVVEGAVTGYTTAQVAYFATDTAALMRLTLTAEATLKERKSQRILWKGSLSHFQDYPAVIDLALQQNAQDDALRETCRRLAEKFYQQMNSAF